MSENSGGTSNSRGITFETRICMLCFVRGFTRQLKTFKLQYQIDEAYKFDDVVFYQDPNNILFIQLKHKNKDGQLLKPANILRTQLGDFGLLKYVKSVILLQKLNYLKEKIKMAVVYTNMTLEIDDTDKSKPKLCLKSFPKDGIFKGIPHIQLREVNLSSDNILNCSKYKKEGKFYQFDDDPNLVQLLKDLSDLDLNDAKKKNENQIKKNKPLKRNKLTEIDLREIDITIDDIKDALQYIFYAVDQPNDEELMNIIKQEIRENGGIEIVNEFYYKLEFTMKQWCDLKKGFEPTITYDIANDFFKFKPLMFNVLKPIESFTGRDKELQDIKNALYEKKDLLISQMAAISGLGGIGKTQLMRKFIDKFGQSDFYGRVFWIAAESNETVEKSFRRLAENLPILNIDRTDCTTIITKVFDFFDKLKTLFVFDNFDKIKKGDEESFVLFCLNYVSGKEKRPYFLFTSRRRECLDDIKTINLDVFQKEEAERLLMNELGKIKKFNLVKAEIEELAKTLQYFPLALQQAISYIKQESKDKLSEKYTLRKYLEEFEIKKEILLKYDNRENFGEYGAATLTTFEVTFDAIKKHEFGSTAIQILQLIAYLIADEINPDIFITYFDNNKQKAFKSLNLIDDYSLISIMEIDGGKAIKIHRLVQTVIQNKFKEHEKQNLEQAIKLVVPKIVKIYLNLIENKTQEQVTKYFYSVINCSTDDALHIHMIEIFLSKYPDLFIKYEKLCKDINKRTFKNIMCSDDLEKLKKINVSEEYLKLYVREYIDYLISQNCLNLIIYFFETKILDVEYKDMNAQPLLHIAAKYKHLDIIQYFLDEGISVNSKNKIGLTPLHVACFTDNIETVAFLIEKKADINALSDDYNIPLHNAVTNGNEKAVELLIEKHCDINAKDKEGRSPLHLSLNYTNLKITNLLIEKNAIIDITNNKKETPLHIAVCVGDLNTVALLLNKGAFINAKDDDLETPLHNAVNLGNFSMVNYLIDKGADINSKNKNDTTPLHNAVFHQYFEISELLVRKKANINAKDNLGETPFHDAARHGNLKILELLVKLPINTANEQHSTPLHLAVEKGDLKIVKFLIKSGAEINVEDENNETPLKKAINNKNWEIIYFLTNHGAVVNL